MIRLLFAVAFTAAAALAQLGGSAGAASSSSAAIQTYNCDVSAASSKVCTHSLNTSQPLVACYDSSGNRMGGNGAAAGVQSVVADTANQVTITFTGSVTGRCVISTGGMGASGSNGAGYTATSTSSLSIGTGSKTFTTQGGLAYSAGARVRASSAANTANYMEGLVTSYSGTSLVVSMDAYGGSGTAADWNLNIAGNVGATGVGGNVSAAGPWYIDIGGTKYIPPYMLQATPLGSTSGWTDAVGTTTFSTVGSATQAKFGTGSIFNVSTVALSTATTLITAYVCDTYVMSTGHIGCGIMLYESGTTKGLSTGMLLRGGSSPNNDLSTRATVDVWSNVPAITNPSSPLGVLARVPQIVWLKIVIGSNIVIYRSHNGSTWEPFYSVSKTTYFTTAPDRIGIYSLSVGGNVVYMDILSWSLT